MPMRATYAPSVRLCGAATTPALSPLPKRSASHSRSLSAVLLLILGLVLPVALGVPVAAQERVYSVTLPAGLEIPVTFPQRIRSSELAAADTVVTMVTREIEYEGLLLAPLNARVLWVVGAAKGGGKLGKPGTLSLKVHSLIAPNGAVVKLQDQVVRREGKSRKWISLIAGFGLFVRGGPATIRAGEHLTVRTGKDQPVMLPRLGS